jgi:hypothetical protein
MSQSEGVVVSRPGRLALVAQTAVVATFLLAAPVVAVAVMQPWRSGALAGDAAVAPADDVFRQGLKIQEPVSADAVKKAYVAAGKKPREFSLANWSYTFTSGATGASGTGGGSNGSPGH